MLLMSSSWSFATARSTSAIPAKTATSTMMYRHDDYIDGIRLVNEGKVHLKPLISKTFAFKDYLKAYQYIDDNRETTMKVIINVSEK